MDGSEPEPGRQRPGGSASPPTDRVVAVVELLAARPTEQLTAAELARTLRMNRSTGAAILSSLELAGWVVRTPDRAYGLGTGLLGVAASVTGLLPILRDAEPVLRRLSRDAGCPCTLTLADDTRLTDIAHFGNESELPAGVRVGSSFPLYPPFGAAIIAFADLGVQRRWIAGGNLAARDAAEWRRLLTSIRALGVGAWRLEPSADTARDAALALARSIEEDPHQPELRASLAALLGRLGARGFTVEELEAPGPVALGYLAAPASDAEGAWYEIELHVTQPAIARPKRLRLVTLLREAAREITARAGGRAPVPARAALGSLRSSTGRTR